MTTALEMYKGVLYELNKFESPDFDVDDFNHFINQAIELWVKNELESYELTQVVSDNLAVLIASTDSEPFFTFNSTNSTDVREKTLPNDYRHALSCLVTLRYKLANDVYALNAVRSDFTKRLTGDSWASIMENSYFMPLVSNSDMRLYHRVTGNKLSIFIDTPNHPTSEVVIKSVNMEYVKQPVTIELEENFTITADTVFTPSVNRAIVLICAKLFLENHQSPRVQSNAQMNK